MCPERKRYGIGKHIVIPFLVYQKWYTIFLWIVISYSELELIDQSLCMLLWFHIIYKLYFYI